MAKFNDYVAWIRSEAGSGWDSVAVGTLTSVKAKAVEIAKSDHWREWNPGATTIRITRGARQLFVHSFVVGP